MTPFLELARIYLGCGGLRHCRSAGLGGAHLAEFYYHWGCKETALEEIEEGTSGLF